MTQPTQYQRLRIVFGKQKSLKYIGHLDLAKLWERTLRRAQLGLSYSQGFNARPKMQLASPLPLGVTSDCEIIDIWLDNPIPLEGLAERLIAVSPDGLPIYRITEVPAKSPALQTLLESATYLITPEYPDPLALRRKIDVLLAQQEIMRTRRDKAYNLRPLLVALKITDQGTIQVELAITPQGTGRPDEVIEALGLDAVGTAIRRIAIRLREVSASEVSEGPHLPPGI